MGGSSHAAKSILFYWKFGTEAWELIVLWWGLGGVQIGRRIGTCFSSIRVGAD